MGPVGLVLWGAGSERTNSFASAGSETLDPLQTMLTEFMEVRGDGKPRRFW